MDNVVIKTSADEQIAASDSKWRVVNWCKNVKTYYLAVDVHFLQPQQISTFFPKDIYFYNEIFCTMERYEHNDGWGKMSGEGWTWKDSETHMNNFHIIICVVYVLFVRMKANNMLPLIC